MGWLDAFTGAASKNAANAQVAGLQQGNEVLGWGGESARKRLQQAQNLYQPMTKYGQTGVDAYQAAMGLGPQGEAGFDLFRQTPGYEFARQQGEESVMRNAAARGMLAGGNTSADLMKYGTGLADQTYGNYLARLNPLMEMYGQGIQGQSNALTGIANNYMRESEGRAKGLGAIGEANAGGIMGAANAQAGTLNAGLNLAGSLFGMPAARAPNQTVGSNLFNRWFG
jgi:hypothetical protein